MLHPEPIAYGTIPILKHELVSLKLETALGQYTVERVSWPTRIVPQSNDYNYVEMTLKVEQASYDLWRDYFVNAPANLQQTLDFGFFSSLSYAVESMNVEVYKVAATGDGQFKYMYKIDLTFIRAV